MSLRPNSVDAAFHLVDERMITTALLFGADMQSRHVMSRHSRYHLANKRTISTYLLLEILVSVDIQLNPGPIKCPCGVCKKAVASNLRAMHCGECDMDPHWLLRSFT